MKTLLGEFDGKSYIVYIHLTAKTPSTLTRTYDIHVHTHKHILHTFTQRVSDTHTHVHH